MVMILAKRKYTEEQKKVFNLKRKYLERAKFVHDEIECDKSKLVQLNDLKSTLMQIKAIDYSRDRVQESNNDPNASYTKVVEKIRDLELKIIHNANTLISLEHDIDNIANELPEDEFKLLFKYKFQQYKDGYYIADKLHVSYRQQSRMTNALLEKIKIDEEKLKVVL